MADIWQHMNIIKTLHEWNYDPLGDINQDPVTAAANKKFADESWARDSQRLPDEIANGSARLEVTHLDFDHDGTVDTVYRYFHRIPQELRSQVVNSQPTEGYWYIYFGTSDDLAAKLFREYSQWDILYDSFSYKGRFYLIAWLYHELRIFEPKKFRHGAGVSESPDLTQIEVCRFRLK